MPWTDEKAMDVRDIKEVAPRKLSNWKWEERGSRGNSRILFRRG